MKSFTKMKRLGERESGFSMKKINPIGDTVKLPHRLFR